MDETTTQPGSESGSESGSGLESGQQVLQAGYVMDLNLPTFDFLKSDRDELLSPETKSIINNKLNTLFIFLIMNKKYSKDITKSKDNTLNDELHAWNQSIKENCDNELITRIMKTILEDKFINLKKQNKENNDIKELLQLLGMTTIDA